MKLDDREKAYVTEKEIVDEVERLVDEKVDTQRPGYHKSIHIKGDYFEYELIIYKKDKTARTKSRHQLADPNCFEKIVADIEHLENNFDLMCYGAPSRGV